MPSQRARTHAPELQPILQLMNAFQPARCLWTAVQLEIFTLMARGKRTVEAVARAAKCSPRGTRMLLDALVGLQLLSKAKGVYELSPLAADYLVKDSPNYMGFLMEKDALMQSWMGLPEAVRTGKPFHAVGEEKEAEAFFPRLVRSLHVMNRQPALRAAKALGAARSKSGQQILDVACGSGVWGIAFAEANSKNRVTMLDFPALLKLTRQFAKKHGVQKQIYYLPGNLREVDYGEEQYDLAILGNIVHSEGEAPSRKLLCDLHRGLKPKGRVAILEFVPNDERTGPVMPLLFSLNMLVNTEEGDTYTVAEMSAWLKDAGFGKVENHDIGSHSPMIVGTKQ